MRTRIPALLAALLAGLLAGPAAARAAEHPVVSAQEAILVEASTGEVLYQRAAEKPRAIASTTKLMTALLTMEHAKLSDKVAASSYVAAPVESKLGLRPGEKLSVADLLRGLMLESANDAAVTLGEHVGGTRAAFVRLMNRRARALGLAHTHYANPIGLDAPGNYSTAHDLAKIAIRLRDFSFIRKIADRTEATLSTGLRPRTVHNRNTLLGQDRWVNGLKTGHTLRAGYVLVGTRSRHRVTLVAVVMGTSSVAARNRDALGLLTWGATQYRRIHPVTRGTIVGMPEIRFRRGAQLALVTERSVARTVRTTADVTTRDIGLPKVVTGPIRRDQRFGYREVLADGKRIATVPIVASAAIPEADLAQRTKDWFTRPIALLLAVAVLGGTVLVGRRLRRGPRRRRTARSEPETA